MFTLNTETPGTTLWQMLVGGHRSRNLNVEAVFEHLQAVERAVAPANCQWNSILDRLAVQLQRLLDLGYSISQISSFLQECEIFASTDAISAALAKNAATRLAAAERQGLRRIAVTEAIEADLRLALRSGSGLSLYYQPQVDMATGRVVGAEALMRWDVGGQFLSPADFIPVAEETELISEIGEWALREACTEASRWQRLGLGGDTPIKVGVNLSVKQISSELPALVHSVLCESGLPSGLLGLEVTESSLADESALLLLHNLSRSGIHLSMDDFGTGYSSLSQLKKFPVGTIKIDQSFIAELGLQGGQHAIVEAIITMAHKMQMTTVAEGVESQLQAETLKRLGCVVGQGHLYSRALTGEAFAKYVGGIQE